MKKSIKGLLSIVMVAIIVFSSFAVCFAADTYKVNIPVKYYQTEARSMLGMINAFRTSKGAWYWNSSNSQKIYPSGLKAYKYDYELERIAMQRAVEIAISFTHERPDGSRWISCYPKGYSGMSENICAGPKSAAAAFERWLEEANTYEYQGHRRNMLGSYAVVGIAGVYYNGAFYWVQEMGVKTIDSTETKANNSDANVPVNLLPSKVTSKTLSVSASSLSVSMGSSVSVPKINGVMEFKDAWMSANPFTVSCTWTSSDPSIVTVSNGKLNPQKAGTTTITTTALGQNFTANVTVKGKSTGGAKTYVVTYDSNGGSVPVANSEVKSGASVTLPKATRKGYTFLGWATSKSATTAQYRGGTTVSFGGDTALYAVWIKAGNPPRIWGVDILQDKVTIDYKGTVKLSTMVDADDGATYTYKWYSKDKTVAKVSQDGTVTGVKKWGKATGTITCYVTDSNGKKYGDTCEVTVGYSWKQWVINTVLFGFLWYE